MSYSGGEAGEGALKSGDVLESGGDCDCEGTPTERGALLSSRSGLLSCAWAIWCIVFALRLLGPRVAGCLLKVQHTPAAAHPAHGGVPVHLIFRILQPSHALLLSFRPVGGIAEGRQYATRIRPGES